MERDHLKCSLVINVMFHYKLALFMAGFDLNIPSCLCSGEALQTLY